MKALKSPVNARWSLRHTAFTSFVSAFVAVVFQWILRATGIIHSMQHPGWGLGELADLIAVITATIGLSAPFAIWFCWLVLNRFNPRPGAKSFDEDAIRDLKRSFELDRGSISLAMVPAHYAKAKPAKSSKAIDLGDAKFVIPVSIQKDLKSFIGRPRTRRSSSILSRGSSAEDILVVTGEPGCGKSVMLQVIHATLSLGIEEGRHSFVPVIVFARDLTINFLKQASQDPRRRVG